MIFLVLGTSTLDYDWLKLNNLHLIQSFPETKYSGFSLHASGFKKKIFTYRICEYPFIVIVPSLTFNI